MYKLTNYSSILKYNDDGSVTSISVDEANTDYQEYLEWTKASPMNVAEEAQ